ncbi:MAG: biotin-dependent carboxyltransferase family protein [Phycisphaerales bacterium]
MSLRVVSCRGVATVQDMGRPGHASIGVPAGGAADALSLRIANLAVGNAEGAAGLEVCLGAVECRAEAPCTVVVSAGDAAFETRALRVGEAIVVRPAAGRARAYLAVAGGIDVPEVLGSRSTFKAAGFGGLAGRAVRAGDVLPIGKTRGNGRDVPLHVRAMVDFALRRRVLRVVSDGAEAELPRGVLRVSPRGDRVGVRLMRMGGGDAIATGPSRGVLHGTIQAPSAGEFVVLGPDGPTTGGYATIGTVIAADLPAVGQLVPGQWVGFEAVGREEAVALLSAREETLWRWTAS